MRRTLGFHGWTLAQARRLPYAWVRTRVFPEKRAELGLVALLRARTGAAASAGRAYWRGAAGASQAVP